MDDIPIYSGEKTELDSCLTCGQFLFLIEDHVSSNKLTEEQMKDLCLSKLSNGALELFQKHYDQPWNELKNILFEKFPIKLSVRDKVEVRKKLIQQDTESIDDFYQRCVQAQYLVSDDVRDIGFEREVLLHFLIGLSSTFRDLVLASKCSSTTEYINEAKKYVQVIKEEPSGVDVKIEVDPLNVEFDAKYPLEDFSQYCRNKNSDKINERKNSEKNIDHVCNLCHKVFTTKYNLKSHMQSFHKKCAKCDKTFKNKNKHYEKWHSELKCKFCEFICKNDLLLKAHIKENHNKGKNSYICQICNEVFISIKSRKEHEAKGHDHLKQTCEICNEVCPSIHFLSKHIVNKHCTNNSDGRILCYYCNKDYSGSGLLVCHILNKHFNQPMYPCSECGKGFNTKNVLKIHIQGKHSEERNYHCDKCPKTFKTLTSLQTHGKNVHEESKNLECKDCGEFFKNKHYLRTHHLCKHAGYFKKVKFVCDDCGESFAVKEFYKIHCIKMHSNASEQEKHMLKCQYSGCDYSGLSKTYLRQHYKKVHEKLTTLHFQCSLCPKAFPAKSILDDHTNGVHLNVKPFQCDICEYATAYRSTLKDHKKAAHGNRTYECPHCNHSAKYKGNLDKHIKNIHKKV